MVILKKFIILYAWKTTPPKFLPESTILTLFFTRNQTLLSVYLYKELGILTKKQSQLLTDYNRVLFPSIILVELTVIKCVLFGGFEMSIYSNMYENTI